LRGIALVDIEAVRDSGGNIVGAVNCFQDITERKRSEEAGLRLAAIIESSDDAIVSKDLDGTITSWNGGAERIFGYLAEEIIGKPITILIPPDRQKEEEAIMGRIRRGQRVEHYQTVRQRKDGGLIDISLSISPVRNAQGNVIGASKIARDITEHKRSEAQIVNLAREAEHRTKNILATVLATVNAAKYGSLSAAGGHVEIAWSRMSDGRLSLRWIESGGPPVTPPTHRGFGTRIIENIIAGQLRGEVRFDWRDQGLTCEIALLVA
jgi:PAS domain S-box-containing protein